MLYDCGLHPSEPQRLYKKIFVINFTLFYKKKELVETSSALCYLKINYII